MKWIFFSYTLPSEPSKARVFVWRQLKKLGAVSFQTLWVLPRSPEKIAELNKLIEVIRQYKGEGLLIEGKAMGKDQDEKITRAFMESRNEEYTEVIEQCADFMKEIEFEIGRKNFIFAEVEVNEKEIEKLKQWLRKVEMRDVIGSPLRKTALQKMKNCEKVFDDFAKIVFLHAQNKKRTEKADRKRITRDKKSRNNRFQDTSSTKENIL
jgi:hypothetical protein